MEFRYCPEDNKTGADPRSRREELENIAQGLAEQLKQDKAKADQVEEQIGRAHV